MKSWIMAGLVLTGLGLGAAAWVASSQGSAPRGPVPVVHATPAAPRTAGPHPRAVTDEALHNFGLVDPTWAVEWVFTVRNAGAAPLQLSRAGTSCACTTSRLSRPDVPPGETAAVTVRSELYDKEGAFHYTAQIVTSDPATPRLDFHLLGEALPRLAATPVALDVGRIPRGKAAQASALVYSKVWNDFVIADGRPSDDRLQWQSAPLAPTELRKLGARCGHRVTVTVCGERPEGPLRQWLDLTVIPGSDQDRSCTLRLPVEGRVPGVAVISGPRINKLGLVDLGIVPQATGTTERLILKIGGEHRRVNILRVTVEPPYLQASVNPVHPGEADGFYRIDIAVPPGTPLCSHTAAETRGAIRVLTDHPEKPELVSLRVSFAVGER